MNAPCLPAILAFLMMTLLLGGCGMAETFAPTSFAYVLQADKLQETRKKAIDALAASKRDLIVLDASYDSTEEARWRPEELEQIRNAHPGRKVVAYLSIGEAEQYRAYWQAAWDPQQKGAPGPEAPSFLCRENPDWSGNYKVRYWEKGWQTLILAEVDRLMAAGFDGLWLDIVDGFEYFEKDGDKFIDSRPNPATGATYRQDMIHWVLAVARQARSRNDTALIIPQNGHQLLKSVAYRNTLSALALECLFTDDNKRQPQSHTDYVMSFLKSFSKPVLLTEYATKNSLKQHASKQSRKAGLVLLLTERPLGALGKSGH